MKISVLTPSYNSARYIKRAIESVLIQDYTNWEHIVVDGASTDNTVEILQSYMHLKWISEPDNGQSDAMNKAFRLSTGDIILYLNADDEFAPGLFSDIMRIFTENPEKDMVVGDLIINENGRIKQVKSSVSFNDVLQYEKFRFPLNPVSYAYRRDLQARIGKFPSANHYTMDYWFLLRAYRIGKLIRMNRICGTFYFNETNKSSNEKRSMIELQKNRQEFCANYFYDRKVLKYFVLKLPGIKGFLKFLGK
jgi:glycosyltransferase involved in cell wall biosynthesis